MQFVRKMMMVGILITGFGHAKQMRIQPVMQTQEITLPAEVPPVVLPAVPAETPEVIFEQPDISKLPAPMNAPKPVIPSQEKKNVTREPKARRERDQKRRLEGAMPTPQQQIVEKQSQKPALSMEDYARNKVATFSTKIVDDIFPKQDTLERILVEFKDEFPGPNKERDMTILYNALINNSELRKNITLKNAVPTYNFIKESLSNAWDKNDNMIWSR